MRISAIRQVVATALALWLSLLSGRLPATPVTALQGRVNDYAQVLGDRKAAIDARLAAHESSSGDQIVVLIVPDLGGQDIESYANDVFTQWKLGSKGVDNGVLMVVAVQDRRARIEVGYGLEGRLTDLASSQILRERMHPRLAAGDYAGGVEAGVDGVLAVLDDAVATPSSTPDESPSELVARVGFWKSGAWVLPLAVALFTLLFGWMASLGGSWWMYLLLGPIGLPLLLLLWSWPVLLAAFVAYLPAVGWWRRRHMWREQQKTGAAPRNSSRKRAATRSVPASWPPSWWQVLVWSGPVTAADAAVGSKRRRTASSGTDGFAASDTSSSSSSSDYSGDGGSSGGGGASDSW